jgi:autotransporter-associated beta strand protein
MSSFNSFASTWCCRPLALAVAVWAFSAPLDAQITVTSGAINTVQSGSGGLDKITDGTGSNGTATLSAVNNYTGGTTVTAGSLAIASPGTLGNVSNALTVSTSGVLDLGGTTQTTGLVTLGGGTIQDGALNSSTGFALQGGTISAILAGAANITQTAGTTTLSGSNIFTGSTTVSGGTLVVGSSNALGGNSDAVVVNGGVLSVGLEFLGNNFSGTGGQILVTGFMDFAGSFNYGGTLNVGTNAVGFVGAGTATVGAVILATGGQITPNNGLVLQAGGNLTATGSSVVNNPFKNSQVFVGVAGGVPSYTSATIQGPTTVGQTLSLSGALTGGGNLNGNINVLNSYTPGPNGAQVTIGPNSNITLNTNQTLTMNLGGVLTPGYSYNQFIIGNGAVFNLSTSILAFTFNGVDSGGTFSPAAGNQFHLFVLNGGSITSTFGTLPATNFGLASGLAWDFSNLYSQGLVTVDAVAVPEPATVAGIIGAAALGFAGLRRRLRLGARPSRSLRG